MKLMIIPSDAVATMGAVAALGGGFRSGRTQPRTALPKSARPWQAVVWIVIALVLLGLELLTLSFVAFYPALGALAAAVAALLGGNFGIQVIVFAVVTVVHPAADAPAAAALIRRTPSVPSNASNVVGRRAVVVIAIEPGPASAGRFGSAPSTGAPSRRTSSRSA